MSKKLDIKQFAKFFYGIATSKEIKNVLKSKESIDMLYEEWNNYKAGHGKSKDVDFKNIFSKIEKEIEKDNKKIFGMYVNAYQFRKIAASVVLFITLGGLLSLLIFNPFASDEIAMITKHNQSGVRSQFVLPDGSTVWLNSESTVKYPEDFNKQNIRQIQLEGEAFFDVKRDINHPFVVKTESIEVTVLGTSFNVMAYKDNKITETTLVTGKVGIERNQSKTRNAQKVILTPNHKAVFNKETDKFIMDKVDAEIYTSWKNGKLIFDNTSFADVIEKIERWYGIDVEYDKELASKYFYTITITNENIEEVLLLLKKTTPIDYTINNKEIIIKLNK